MQLDVICWFLLTLFNGVFADKRLVKQDSLVCLFQNVTVDKAYNEVRLYVIEAENDRRIVTFKYVDGEISMQWDAQMADNYSKIFMDAKRNIWIANIDETYEGKFQIYPSDIEVELTILKTNYSTTERTTQKETTQKGETVPETSYSTTERTALQETTQKGDALLDLIRPESGFCIASYVFNAFVIIVFLIKMVKKMRIAWIKYKKCNRNKNSQESVNRETEYSDLNPPNRGQQFKKEGKSKIDDDTSRVSLG